MRMRAFKYLIAGALTWAAFSFLPGCEDTATDEDVSAKLEQAHRTLEDAMLQLFNLDDPLDLDLVNFQTPYELYQEAVDIDPSNPDAKLGLALTGILRLNGDPDILSARDEFIDYFDTTSLFDKKTLNKINGRRIRTPLDISIHPFNAGLAPNNKDWVTPYIDMQRIALAKPPLASEIQSIINNTVLPAFSASIGLLNEIETDLAYTFKVTPKMQGDIDADTAEMDMTEIKAFHAGLLTLSGVFKIFTAYNLELADYTVDDMVAALQPGSDFLTLNVGHQLPQARTDMIAAMDKLLEAIDFLRNESDDQDDDIIKTDTSTITDELLDNVESIVNDAKDGLSGVVYIADLDSLKVNLGNFFTNPVQDMKAMLPTYQAFVFESLCSTHPDIKFNSLIWPDPTLNGIFPDFTSDDLNSIFGIDTLGAESLTAIVDGNVWEACWTDAYISTPYLEIGGEIDFSKATSRSEKIEIYIADFDGPGVYTLSDSQSGNYARFYDWIAGLSFETDATHTGTLTITTYDDVNGAVTGTFVYTGLENNQVDTVVVTVGVFSVRD